MRVALLTEGGYPYAHGQAAAWCDRLLRGLTGHDFEVFALSRSRRQEAGPRLVPPAHVRRVRTAPLWGPPPPAFGRGDPPAAPAAPGGRLGRRLAECFAELAAALCGGPAGGPTGGPAGAPVSAGSARRQADRFATGLYGLAELAVANGGLADWPRSEQPLRVLESACRTPGAPRAVRGARRVELLAVLDRLERALRPLSLDWYGGGARGDEGLAAAALCHAVGGDLAVLPGLLAWRFFGTPLLVTEVGSSRPAGGDGASSEVAAHAVAPTTVGAPVRALLAAFRGRLTEEARVQAVPPPHRPGADLGTRAPVAAGPAERPSLAAPAVAE